MKSYILSACAVLIAVGLCAFGEINKGKRAVVYFIYGQNDTPNEASFETVSNWTYSTSPLSCNPGTRSTCRVAINTANITGYNPATPELSFVNYLIDQDLDPGEYASAVAAVNALGTKKP